MTTLAYTLSDSRVMLRRNLKHQLRYPSMTLMLVGTPIVLLLLFVYVFGGQLGAGLGEHLGRHAYLDYVVPGLMLITGLSADPTQAFGVDQVIELRVSATQAQGVQAFANATVAEKLNLTNDQKSKVREIVEAYNSRFGQHGVFRSEHPVCACS